MNFSYNSIHLDYLKANAQLGHWKTNTPEKWISSIGQPPLSLEFSKQILTRDLLKEACENPKISDRDLLWGILAWGKMHRLAARRFAPNEARWIDVVRRLRQGNLTRSESYRICFDTVADLPSGGIGPAYFTKIIFFANPRHDGYIMDQWTSRSVNLLSSRPVIKIQNKNYVLKSNDECVFEEYCQIVEDLSLNHFSAAPEEVEQYLFSTGGRSAANWRKYVKART